MQTVGQDSVEDWTASITCRQWDSKTVLKTGQLVLYADSGTVRQC